MKTIAKIFFVALLTGSSVFAAQAQQSNKGKLEVTTRLTESKGTLEERQLYREFLVEYMKQCPYISNFSVQPAIGSSDNHNVVWTYNVNSWDDITKFYGWVNEKLKSNTSEGLKKALTPYNPDYAIGGQINVTDRHRDRLARD